MVATTDIINKWLPQSLIVLNAVLASVWMATPAVAAQNFSDQNSKSGTATRLTNRLKTPKPTTQTLAETAEYTELFDIFFGEDLGLGEQTRRISRPNSDSTRNSFFSNLEDEGLVNVGTEDFERFPNQATAPLDLIFANAGDATLQGSASISYIPTGTNQVGRYPISGNQYLEIDKPFSINFSKPVVAFGFYGTDIGDFGGQLILGLTLNDGSTTSVSIPHTLNGTGGAILYFGLISRYSDVFVTQVAFGNTAADFDLFGFDDLTIATLPQIKPPPPSEEPQDVPEPTAVLGIFALGTLGTIFRMKR